MQRTRHAPECKTNIRYGEGAASMGNRCGQRVLAAIFGLLMWLALSDAKAGCTEPTYTYFSPYSHIGVHRTCDTRADVLVACSEFAEPFQPYYNNRAGCF